MGTVKTFIVAACCSLILLGAVGAHASVIENGLSMNGLSFNGLSFNGCLLNGIPLQCLQAESRAYDRDAKRGLTFNALSQSGLGRKILNP